MSDDEYDFRPEDILPLLQEIDEFEYEERNFSEGYESLDSDSAVAVFAEGEQAEPCDEDNAENDNKDFCSITSQETVENNYNRSTNEKYDSPSEGEPTSNQEKNVEDEKNIIGEGGSKSNKLHDPDRDKLLAMLEDDEEPEMSIEDKLEKILEENKDEEKNKKTNPSSVLNQDISSNSNVPAINTPILHPHIDTLIDLTDERKVVTIKVEPVENVIVIDDDPCVKEEKEDTGDKTATEGAKIKKRTQNLNPEPSTSSIGLHKKNTICKKVEKVIVTDDNPCVKEEKEDTRDKTATEGGKIKKRTQDLNPEPSTSSIGLHKKNTTCKKDIPIIIIEDDPPIKVEKINIKKKSNTTEGIVLKSERQGEPAPSTSCSMEKQVGTEKEKFPINEAEEGEVVDDSEIPVNNILKVKREPVSLINPALGNVAAAFGVEGLPQNVYASLLATYQISKMVKSIDKLTKYVSKHKGRKKSHKKKSKRKSKPKRSRTNSSSSRSTSRSRSRSQSRSLSRSRSVTRKNKSNAISLSKKTCLPKQYRSRSPSQSPLRGRHLSSYKKNYRSNSRSRSSSRSLSKSPQRKRHNSNSFKSRPYSRSPSLPKTKTLVAKKDFGKRSPSASPPRRKRRYSSSSSSSTDSSSSSPRYKRRRRSVSSGKSRSRSRTPKKSHTIHSSKNLPSKSVSNNSIKNLPSTSQQTFVAQQTYQQEIRQGSSVMMTRQAIVTTSYKEELKSFKNSLVKTALDSSNGNNFKNICELNKLEITVFDEGGKDVTSKRPDGDLNHPFYIHPEDAELYQMKCRNGLQPLQALHEICVKCGWRLPNYLLLPTPKGFRFGMEINSHRFVTEKTAQQKKLAKAAAALTVLQWMKIVSISPDC